MNKIFNVLSFSVIFSACVAASVNAQTATQVERPDINIDNSYQTGGDVSLYENCVTSSNCGGKHYVGTSVCCCTKGTYQYVGIGCATVVNDETPSITPGIRPLGNCPAGGQETKALCEKFLLSDDTECRKSEDNCWYPMPKASAPTCLTGTYETLSECENVYGGCEVASYASDGNTPKCYGQCSTKGSSSSDYIEKCACKATCPTGAYSTLLACTKENNDGCKKSGSCYVPFTCDDVTLASFIGFSSDGSAYEYLDVRLSSSAADGYTIPKNTYVNSFKAYIHGSERCLNTRYVEYLFENSEYTEDDNERFESEGIGYDLYGGGTYYYEGSENNGSYILVADGDDFYSVDDGLSRGGLYINGEKCYWSVTNSVYGSQGINSTCSEGGSGETCSSTGSATIRLSAGNCQWNAHCQGKGGNGRSYDYHPLVMSVYKKDGTFIGQLEGSQLTLNDVEPGTYVVNYGSGYGFNEAMNNCGEYTFPDGVRYKGTKTKGTAAGYNREEFEIQVCGGSTVDLVAECVTRTGSNY